MIGLSGGIGSGKSTVAAVWRELGATVVDADHVAREVVAPGTPGLAALAAEFGDDLIQPDGTLNRALLAQRAFVDSVHTERLNSILQPAIAARSAELLAVAPCPQLAVYDVPLLVEHDMAGMFEHIVMVLSPAEQRLERLVHQRGLATDDARARMAQQATDAQRREIADIIIDNDGTVDELRERASSVWRYLESCCST
ncbi:dephospho-CoA kinase [Lawsonella clevelandensis]|uniref:Dephospho-CoA kinase n=1 Tax=Lawsonella clevelandensis TaxID=1528099 RepID=A0A5E3ZZF2_9ACTN|nr:dephospho-CoA kinase [Lawsonella clevelandensis]ALE35151.1 hypothetical protein IY73_07990 [Lawsonella clevelandensis]MDU7194157.1 dephospho-CoA kinase [Lawsonella clevelandensis]VHO01690.1 Dephospho-CoA kinase [Lawsonella clevelandensis]